MGLDYDGIPKPEFERELVDIPGGYRKDLVLDPEPVTEDEATETFNELARTLIKGDKLQTALAELNPAAFIPVEGDTAVRSSLARLGEQQDRITFGLFQTACSFINKRGEDIDEAFLIELNIIDPINLSSTVTRRHKGISDSSDDWLTEFLTTLSPLAGLTIMGYLNDLAFSKSGKAPVPDGPVAGTQPTTSHLQGIGVAIALLIEVGITLAGLDIITEPFHNDEASQIVADTYNELKSSPQKRKEVLDEAGYDYDKLCKNKKYDDYMAVKQYALEYISRLADNIQYDHWIAFANVADNQSFLSSAMAMAPLYSKKWQLYNRTGSVDSLEEVFETEDAELDLEAAVASGLNRGLRDYFSSLLQVSNNHYNTALQTFSMQIDDRLMCCIIWFLGPMDVGNLKAISNMLQILSARSTMDWKSLLSRLGEGVSRSVTNMLMGYIGSLIEDVFNNVLSGMFKIPNYDWEVALKKCVGIELLFNLLQTAWLELFQEVNKLMHQLTSMINDLERAGELSVHVAAERRYLTTLAGLIRAVIDKLEYASETCDLREDMSPEQANEIAAEAAVEFVSAQIVDNQYPTITLSEDLRRKFFRDVPEFQTRTLKLPVPGLDETGNQQQLTKDEKIAECGAGGRATQGINIGKKIADIMNG